MKFKPIPIVSMGYTIDYAGGETARRQRPVWVAFSAFNVSVLVASSGCQAIYTTKRDRWLQMRQTRRYYEHGYFHPVCGVLMAFATAVKTVEGWLGLFARGKTGTSVKVIAHGK